MRADVVIFPKRSAMRITEIKFLRVAGDTAEYELELINGDRTKVGVDLNGAVEHAEVVGLDKAELDEILRFHYGQAENEFEIVVDEADQSYKADTYIS